MRVTDIFLVAGYTVASTIAILLVKQYASPAIEAWKVAPGLSTAGSLLLLGAALYAVSFLVWMVILSRNELSLVYPLMIGLTLVATTMVSWILLKEPLHMLRLTGIGIIFVGVVLVTRS